MSRLASFTKLQTNSKLFILINYTVTYMTCLVLPIELDLVQKIEPTLATIQIAGTTNKNPIQLSVTISVNHATA